MVMVFVWQSYSDRLDQLNVIFDIIGTPSKEDLVSLRGDVKTYLDNLEPKPPTDFTKVRWCRVLCFVSLAVLCVLCHYTEVDDACGFAWGGADVSRCNIRSP